MEPLWNASWLLLLYTGRHMDFAIIVTKTLLKKRLIQALVVGVVAVCVQTAVFELLGVVFRLTAISTATVIGAEFGILTNFYLNNTFSFGDRTGGNLFYRLIRFHTVVSGSVFIQWLSLFIAERLTENLFLLHIVYVSSILVGFIWNYSWYKIWVWKHVTEDAVPL